MKSFWLAEAEVAGAGREGQPRYKTAPRQGQPIAAGA